MWRASTVASINSSHRIGARAPSLFARAPSSVRPFYHNSTATRCTINHPTNPSITFTRSPLIRANLTRRNYCAPPPPQKSWIERKLEELMEAGEKARKEAGLPPGHWAKYKEQLKKHQQAPQPPPPPKPTGTPGFKVNWTWVIASAIVFSLISRLAKAQTMTFQEFKQEYIEKAKPIENLRVGRNNEVSIFVPGKSAPVGKFTIGNADSFERQMEDAQTLLEIEPQDHIPIVYDSSGTTIGDYVTAILPTAIFVYILYRVMRGSGGFDEIMSFGKSPAKRFDPKTGRKVTFSDVAGLEEAKAEIMEFVTFLKSPAQFEKLGARMPKGALLVGPPGTGKTLLAKAAAGEAGVPFFSVSGSDFVEIFGGVGSMRVRELFKEGRKNAPCILFIDEIDSIGKARTPHGNISGGHSERENTLNQLLVEMDGFSTSSGVIVLAGTNRADILDKALTRPGRFDRQIALDQPDIKSREEIFLVHLKPLKLHLEIAVTAKRLAVLTPGFSGADIANVCNEAALIAARYDKKQIEDTDFDAAIDRIIGGIEKKNKVLSPEEKRTVAYHEAGHAVTSWYLENCDPLLKVSIVPRGAAALGYAQYLPKDQYLMSIDQLFDRMCMALGGRVAEAQVFGKISTGAQDDLDRVTKMAYQQILGYGMNDKVGPLSFVDPQQQEAAERPYSEKTAELVDAEAKALVQKAFRKTTELLREKTKELKLVAERLLEKEKLNADDMVVLLGERPLGRNYMEEAIDILPPSWQEEVKQEQAKREGTAV